MICNRCRRNNPTNTNKCIYCGTPLYSSYKKKNNKKQTESVIVALIIVMLVLLVAVVGVYIYNSNSTKNLSFGSGNGGGSLPPPTFATNTPNEVQPDNEEVIREPIEEVVEEDNDISERLSKKDEFLEKADDIEWYSENYLETAETQSEINSESSIVYKKWDTLLNEVYQYLKTIMSDSEFKQLQEDEIAWITKKEKAIDAAGAEWEGGSGEPMARNMTAIQYTEERCYYLISLIN